MKTLVKQFALIVLACVLLTPAPSMGVAAALEQGETSPPPPRIEGDSADAGGAAAQTASAPSPTADVPPSDTWYAMRSVRVPVSQYPEDARAAVHEVTATRFLGQVLESNGLPAAILPAIALTVCPVDEGEAVDVGIVVDLTRSTDAPRVAREAADAVVEALQQRLAESAVAPLLDQRRLIQMEFDRAEAEHERARRQMAEIRAKVREATGRTPRSAERIREELADLERARQELQLERETRAARVRALSESIARVTQQIEQKVHNDPVAAELQKIVAAREQQAERLRQLANAGGATQGEYDNAMAEAAEARARLLERRAEAAAAAGADTVNAWNEELMRVAVDSVELQVRLDALGQRVQGYQKIAADLDDLEEWANSREYAEESLIEARDLLRNLNRALATARPPRAIVTRSVDRTGPIPQPGHAEQSEGATEARGEDE